MAESEALVSTLKERAKKKLERDLGPLLAHFVLPIAGKGGSDWSYAWIPVVGPLIGGVIGALVYKGLWPAI